LLGGYLVAVVNFNPRAYVRHDWGLSSLIWVSRDFNPRAYVRHDGYRPDHQHPAVISIHVPT